MHSFYRRGYTTKERAASLLPKMPPIHNNANASGQQPQGGYPTYQFDAPGKKQYLRKTKNGNFQPGDLNGMPSAAQPSLGGQGTNSTSGSLNRYNMFKSQDSKGDAGHHRVNLKSVDATNGMPSQFSSNGSTLGANALSNIYNQEQSSGNPHVQSPKGSNQLRKARQNLSQKIKNTAKSYAPLVDLASNREQSPVNDTGPGFAAQQQTSAPLQQI